MQRKTDQKRVRQNKFSNKTKQETVLFKSFDDFLNKYGFYLLLFLITVIVFFVFKDFIFLKKIYLFNDIGSDSVNFNYPVYRSLAEYIPKEGFPKWSFSQGMGQNIFPIGTMDPFSLFILLMGKDHVYYTLFIAEAFKIFFAGIFFYLFLKKIVTSNYTAIIGGVLYSFTGFIILGGEWVVFSTEAVYIALLLYSFERLYQDNSWILFPVSIFLIASNQPFDIYFLGLFLVIYILFRLFEENGREPKKILILLAKLTCLGILGIAISSFFLTESIQMMLQSPRVSGESSYAGRLMSKHIFGFEGEEYGSTHYLTAFMRFLSSDMAGTGSDFKGWYNYLEAPMFYCGLVSLLLLPHFLSITDKRKKIIYFVFLLTFIFPVIFPYFRYGFWLFTGNYYRAFSIFVVLAVLLVSLKSLDNIDKKSRTNIFITGITLMLLLFFLNYSYVNAKIINTKLRDIALLILIIYSVLIYLLQYKTIKNIVKLVLLFVIVIELMYFSNITINKRPVVTGADLKQKIGYNDYTVDAVEFLKSKDKTFFRINKDYSSGTAMHSSINDARAQGFYGTPSYHSFNQLNYIKFLQELNILDGKNETQTRWAPGLSGSPLIHGFASIKYTLSKSVKPQMLRFGYDSVTTVGNVKILENKYYLPLGFGYSRYIKYGDYHKLSNQQKMIVLNKAFVLDESIEIDTDAFSEFQLKDTIQNYTWFDYGKDIDILKNDTLKIIENGQNRIAGSVNLKNKRMLFFSIPYDKGWTVKVDGKESRLFLVNIGFTGLFLDKGEHQIELNYLPLYFYTGAVISIMSIILLIIVLVIKRRKYSVAT